MKSQAFPVALAAVCLGLAACGDSVTDTGAESRAPTPGGWIIAPQGDLNAFFDCLEAEGAALVSAHRGGPHPGHPENALQTMAALLQEVPAIMEIDLAASADGVLYLMHDDTIERTTNGEGMADALSWAELSSLRLEDDAGAETPFAPTRFSDALAWADGRTLLQIDFKRSASYEDAAAEIKRQDAEDRVILIAYSLNAAKKLHRLLPHAMISLSLSSQSELNGAVAAGVPDERLVAFTGTEEPNARLYSVLEGQDVEAIFATLGDADSIDAEIARSGAEERYAEIATAGADIIATDRPREAYAALNVAGRAVRDGICGVQRR